MDANQKRLTQQTMGLYGEEVTFSDMFQKILNDFFDLQRKEFERRNCVNGDEI